jgi:hypothetical protein
MVEREEATMLSTDDIRALNEARTILKQLEADCGKRRRATPDSYTDPDGYDHGRVAEAAAAAEWAIFNALNVTNACRVRRIPDELLHNTEDSPVRHHGRIEDATTDSEDDGFHITIVTDTGAHEYAAGDGRAILDAAAPILDHWAEGRQAAAEHQRHLEAVAGDGYEPTDPKSEGWHDRMSEIHDSREKA